MGQAKSSTHWQTYVRRRHEIDDDGNHDHHGAIADDADAADDNGVAHDDHDDLDDHQDHCERGHH